MLLNPFYPFTFLKISSLKATIVFLSILLIKSNLLRLKGGLIGGLFALILISGIFATSTIALGSLVYAYRLKKKSKSDNNQMHDLENVNVRVDREFDYKKVKSAKDDFEDLTKRNGNPWHAFHNKKTDELQVVNIDEWRNKDHGRYVDIFQDGVTLDKNEVTAWKKALKTGKLGKFPLRKAAYLLKELNRNPGMKILKGTALAGIPALLDVVEAKDGFTELANEELTAREKVLAGLKAYAATAGLASLTPAAPVAVPTSIATGLLHSGIQMMDAQKIKKQREQMLSLGIEQLPNGQLLDSAQNVVQYDYEKGQIITPQLGQGPVKKLTKRGSR